MSDFDKFLHGAAKFGGHAAKFLADCGDRSYRNIERRLENGERVTPEQLDAYMKYNPEAAARVRAAGERWIKWGRGERD